MGATEEDAGFSEETTAEGLLLLTSFVARVAPVLAKASVTASWAGLRAVTGSGRPVVGRLDHSGRLFAATGHGSQGILTAAVTGAIVAEAMQGTRHELLADLEPR